MDIKYKIAIAVGAVVFLAAACNNAGTSGTTGNSPAPSPAPAPAPTPQPAPPPPGQY